ncbi:MAG: hypothetical protein HYU41_00150 [Candidatus Rokubacteria bacterium]|nr:hypothetical protein [Candidatus Rokubacteria bacterium]
MEPKKQKFSVGYSIAALLALFLIQSVFFAPHAENLSYSQFKALARKGKVSNQPERLIDRLLTRYQSPGYVCPCWPTGAEIGRR